MTTAVTYDARSFALDGRRIWIVGGEVHYFRHPREEWRSVLLRARRAGLNTIATYVPWNYHEPAEGVTDLGGDKDLGHYLDLVAEAGMYAMVRPGPYICSEWDGGGIPAWLSARPVRRFREDDPVYLAAVERWFARLLPVIADRQVTSGGPVITVQNENEYPGGWDASTRGYVLRLNELFRKHGIEVPILACNVHGATETTIKINDSTVPAEQVLEPGMILTYNHHTVVEPVRDLRAKQPDAPLIATEFWSGAPVYWGEQVSDWPDRLDLARAAYEYASLGTQVVYYMFEGGTNFGFWAGNNIATSYASGYPVGDGGLLTDKYYAVRPPNLFAAHFGDLLAGSEEVPDRAGIVAPDGIRLVVRGSLAFVSTPDGRGDFSVELPGGMRLPVHFGEVRAGVLPVGLTVFDGSTVDYANLTLLVRDEARRALVLCGPAGTDGVVSVNGEELVIPVRRGVEHRRVGGLALLVVDEATARRCWTAGGHVVFGADFVGEVAGDGSVEVLVRGRTPDVVRLDAAGVPVPVPFPATSGAPEPAPPALAPWTSAACLGGSQRWAPLAEPLAHERLGVTQGYVWYAAELASDEDRVETLLLTHAPNRVSVFVNGRYSGTHAERRSVRMRDEYAHPADWSFEELTVRLRRGTNTLVFLSDDLGHNYDVPAPVGIQGPVYAGSRRLDIDDVRAVGPLAVSADAFHFLYDRHYREPDPLPAVEFALPLRPGEDAVLTIHGVHAWVTVDGEDLPPLSYPESPWTMFTQIKRWLTWLVPGSAEGGTRTVRIQYRADGPSSVLEHLTAYTVPAAGRCGNWRWRAWDGEPGAAGSSAVHSAPVGGEDPLVLLPVGGRPARKARALVPAWFETSFDRPAGGRPVFLAIGQLQKGQIFLNGYNVGRFWRSGGTEDRYYLPRSWMRDRNRLTVFEELGCHPHDAALEFGEAGGWIGVRLP